MKKFGAIDVFEFCEFFGVIYSINVMDYPILMTSRLETKMMEFQWDLLTIFRHYLYNRFTFRDVRLEHSSIR